jgi:hypothetical protein
MPPRLDDCIDNEGLQYIGDGTQDEQYLAPKLPMGWAKYSHRIRPSRPTHNTNNNNSNTPSVKTLATTDVKTGLKLKKQ